MANKELNVQSFYQILQAEIKENLQSFLKDLHPVDIAEIIEVVKREEQQLILSLLDSETVAEVFNELDSELAGALLGKLEVERATEVLEEMFSDDAADFLGELPKIEQDKYLEMLEVADAEDVQELMEYKEDTAGGLMTTEFVAIREDITADRAIEVLREIAPDAETVYYVYVINLKNQLVGVISLRELIIANPENKIEDIMRRKVISVIEDTDQEEVARIVTKYDFLAVPVVNHKHEILGIITVDDIIDVIHEEAAEDTYRLAGMSVDEVEDDTFYRISSALKSRLPWLFVTMLGGLLSGQVLRGFSSELDTVVALTFFIPLLTGMGGNVGTQSSTVTVRGIATGQINANSTGIFKAIIKESFVGLSIGVILGVLVGIIASIWQGKPMLGVVVGLAMLGNMFTAATMGTLVPLFFKRIGIDPAVASAPFISTAIDITGLLIYSTLASLLIAYLI